MKMNCRIVDLRNKEVICIKNGARLGYVSDVEVDTCDARLVSIIIYGKPRLFGLLGHEDDCVIDWCDIEVIGEDSILVSCQPRKTPDGGCRKNLLESFLCSLC